MEALASSEVFLFENFRLDRRGGLFRRDDSGAFAPVAIGSRALDILGVLIARAGEVVSKDDIIAAIWPETVVEDSNLTVQISALRRVLDRGRSQGSYIQTVSGRGYRFVAKVTHPAVETPSDVTPKRMAEQAAENIAGPVQVYGVPEAIAGLAASSMPTAVRRRPGIVALAVAAAGAMVLIIAINAWWVRPTIKPEPASAMAAATSVAQPLSAPRLSIVVLPFADLGNDPDQQYLADGITGNLTTDLSRIANSFVISRNTALTYRDRRVDTKRIGRELGVRYVLEGSVQRLGNLVRVNAQLIDAATDTYIWAERFDRDASDLLALQNEITGRIRNTLGLELIVAEANGRSSIPTRSITFCWAAPRV
jgi:TolB-like protein/DNA-binding winged helix-turn-helix (wHTH) protein